MFKTKLTNQSTSERLSFSDNMYSDLVIEHRLVYTKADSVDHDSLCEQRLVYTTADGIDHELWCEQCLVHTTTDDVDTSELGQ